MNNEMLNKLKQFELNDGFNNTNLKEVKLYKASTNIVSREFLYVYDTFVIFVLNRNKELRLEHTTLKYDIHNYLISSATLPFEYELFASKDNSFYSLMISLDETIMYQVMQKLSTENTTTLIDEEEIGVFTDSVTPEIENIVMRLFYILESKEESEVLGESILTELFYRILKSEKANILHKFFDKKSNEAKISRVLKKIHKNYHNYISIPDLAKEEDISIASLYTYFKKITLLSPLQYIKKLRLNQAHYLISDKKFKVLDAAYAVGYESTSQFSREYKKYFGYPPSASKNTELT